MRAHPAADLFPMMTDSELQALAKDIKSHGLRQPIITLEENGERVVLDGRNRFRACAMSGVEPTFLAFDGDDPFALVVSANLTRRHLDSSQRSMIANEMARLRHGMKKADASKEASASLEATGQQEAADLSLYPDADLDLLVKKLSSASPRQLLTKMKNESRQSTQTEGSVYVLVEIYNRGTPRSRRVLGMAHQVVAQSETN